MQKSMTNSRKSDGSYEKRRHGNKDLEREVRREVSRHEAAKANRVNCGQRKKKMVWHRKQASENALGGLT